MKQFSDQTAKIISAHSKDFNSGNYGAKIKSLGGYTNYVKGLGGVFKTWTGRTESVKTVSEFRECAEYVLGLMSIWGFDYNNGRTYYHWGSGSTGKPASDAFYLTGRGKCCTGTISELCQGTGSRARTTNCNYGVDTLLKAAGLYKTASSYFTSWATKYGKPVANKADLKPGDMVHFFTKPIGRTSPGSWKNGTWKHIAIVHTVDKAGGKVWLIDFGSRFIRTKKPLHFMPLDSGAKAGGEYSAYYWAAVHAFDLKASAPASQTVTVTGSYPTCKKGSKGLAVKWVQAAVNAKIDGNFADKTEAAVKAYQKKKKNLTVDGVVGPKTWAAIIGGLT
jgi:peptidoglycan hydrolase-like protein with peptidoglycan-binding domain